MQRRLWTLAIVVTAWLLTAAAPSDAAVYCIGSPVNCPAEGVTPSPPKLDRAVELAGLSSVPDVILLGAGTFSGNGALIVPQNTGGTLLVQGQGATTLLGGAQLLDAEATVTAVAAVVPASGAAITVTRGTADAISIDGSGAGVTGVRLGEGGRLSNSTVSLTGVGSVAAQTTAGDGTVTDSVLSACTGVLGHSTGTTIVQRTEVTASTGLDTDLGNLVADSSSFQFPQTPSCALNAAVSMRGAATAARNVRVTNLTAVGGGQPGTAGIRLSRDSGTAAMTADILSSVVTGFLQTLVPSSATADPAPTATISASAIDEATAAGYLPGAEPNFDNPVLGFVNSTTGDFRLTHESALIDRGEAAGPLGASATDPDGGAREIDGKPIVNGTTPRRDVGAFEYVPGLPTVAASAAPPTGYTEELLTFEAAGDPGDADEAITYEWAFDDGTTATGELVDKAFLTPGDHVATVTATDASGWTVTDDVTVTIEQLPPPPPPDPEPEDPGPVVATTTTVTPSQTPTVTTPARVPVVRGPSVAFTRRAAAVDDRGRVALRVQCRATSATCVGRVTLTTVRRVRGRNRTIKLGAAVYRVGPGEIATVRLKINRTRLRILRGTGVVTAQASATVTGGRTVERELAVRQRP